MDTSRSNISIAENDYKCARRKFLSWAMQWSCSEPPQPVQEPNGFDVMDIVNLLRPLGFKLRCYDKCSPVDATPLAGPPGGHQTRGCRVVLSCNTSGLRVILENSGNECHCPDVQQDRNSSWHVTGSVPTSSQEQLNKIDTAGSTIMPVLNPGANAISPEIITKLLNLLTRSSDDGLNISNASSRRYSTSNMDRAENKSFSRYRSLDALVTKDATVGQPLFPKPKPLKEIQGAMKTMEINPTSGLNNRTSQHASKIDTKDRPPPLVRQSTWTEPIEASSPLGFNQFPAEDTDAVIVRLQGAMKQMQMAIKSLQYSKLNFANTSLISAIGGPDDENLSYIFESNTRRNSSNLNTSAGGSRSSPTLFPLNKGIAGLQMMARNAESSSRRTLSNLSTVVRREKVKADGLMTSDATTQRLTKLPPIVPKRVAAKKRPLHIHDIHKNLKTSTTPLLVESAPTNVHVLKKRDLGTKCTSFSGLPLTPRVQSNFVSKLASATKRLTPNALLKTPTVTPKDSPFNKPVDMKKK